MELQSLQIWSYNQQLLLFQQHKHPNRNNLLFRTNLFNAMLLQHQTIIIEHSKIKINQTNKTTTICIQICFTLIVK